MLKLRSIALELTPRCNQRCRYCYNAWRAEPMTPQGELSHRAICSLIDRVLSEAQLEQLTLTGGEPFLRPDILSIIEHINGRGLGVSIISNGGPVDAPMARELARRRINYVQITLTGPDAPTHDAHCGDGSFAATVRGIGQLVAAGVAAGGSYLCTSRNFGAAGRTLQRMHDLGVRHHFALNRFNPSGRGAQSVGELMPTRSQVIDALGQVQRLAAERDLRIHCTMPIPPCVVDPADYPHVQFGQCAVGTDQAEYAVDPRGRLKLCTLQKDTIGSLLESSLGDLLARGEAQRFRDAIPAFCRPCPHRQTCMGGCRAAAQWVCGRVDELDPFIAQHVRPRHSTAGRSPAAARADEQGGIRVDPWFDLVYHVLAHLSVEPSDASSLYEPRYIQAMGAQLSASGAGRTLVEDATLMASLYVQCGQGHRLHAWPLLHASVEEFLAGATAGFGQLAWDDIRRQDLAATMQSSLGMPLIELFRLALAEEWEGGYGQAWRQTILPKASAYRPVFASHLSEIGDSLAQIGSARWVLSYPMGRHGRLLSFANDAPTVVVGVADPDSGVDEWFPLMQGCHELFVHRAQAAVPCEGAFSTVRGRPGYEAFGRCEDAALRMGEEFFGGTRWQGAYRAWRSSVAPLAGT